MVTLWSWTVLAGGLCDLSAGHSEVPLTRCGHGRQQVGLITEGAEGTNSIMAKVCVVIFLVIITMYY